MAKIVTYKNDLKHCYAQLRLDSGERILVSIARHNIRIYKLSLMGMLPTSTIWSSTEVEYFMIRTECNDDALDGMCTLLSKFNSISDIAKAIQRKEIPPRVKR
jgi:hypothetical protein